jgi:5-dehydro-2-deoxygluconokinase
VIEHYDPRCHGVLMLGLDAPEQQLRQSFQLAAQFPVCKGFAVGRSIFGAAARSWFAGKMDDDDATALIADNYRRMIAFWQESSAAADEDNARSATA